MVKYTTQYLKSRKGKGLTKTEFYSLYNAWFRYKKLEISHIPKNEYSEADIEAINRANVLFTLANKKQLKVMEEWIEDRIMGYKFEKLKQVESLW